MTASEIIERHLSEEQMQEIAADEFRTMCREYFNRCRTDAISNVAYTIVREAVAEVLGESADDLIRDKAIEVINGLSPYTVFHEPSAYSREATPAWKLLQKVVRDNEAAVQKVVAHHIHNLSKHDALEIIKGSKLTIQTSA